MRNAGVPRKAGQPQSVGEQCQVLRAMDRKPVVEVGKPQGWIEPAQALHGLLRGTFNSGPTAGPQAQLIADTVFSASVFRIERKFFCRSVGSHSDRVMVPRTRIGLGSGKGTTASSPSLSSKTI